MTSFFLIDCIATFPYNQVCPWLIYLRYIKLFKVQHFHNDLTELIFALISPCVKKSKQPSVVALIKLVFMVICVAHLIACIWMVIGQSDLHGTPNWIMQVQEEVFQDLDFFSVYISALYLVILSFSSVGYGDIRAEPEREASMLFALFTMMLGLVLYGYMLGTLQKILSEIGTHDIKADFEEKLDMFIVKLGGCR